MTIECKPGILFDWDIVVTGWTDVMDKLLGNTGNRPGAIGNGGGGAPENGRIIGGRTGGIIGGTDGFPVANGVGTRTLFDLKAAAIL